MRPAACCSLVVFTLCHVQCQLVQFVENDIDLKNVSTKDLLTSGSGWSLYDGGQHSGSVRFLPISAPASRAPPQSQPWQLSDTQPSPDGRRKRRQAYSGNNFNTGGGFSWNHEFHLSPVHVLPPETTYIWNEVSNRLKNTLENNKTFEFLSPKGLRISIPADNINVRIEDFRLKLNEEFGGNDRGNYAPTNYKRDGLWTYDFPDVKTLQGDKVYYVMRVKFIKERMDVNVNGVLKVTLGDPHKGGNRNRTPSPLPPPQTSTAPLAGGRPGGSSGSNQGSRWNHKFTINTMSSTVFTTQESASRWSEEAQILKSTLNDMKFHFLDPTGLSISISDNNLNMRIVDFRLKVNEEFRDNDGGHYAPVGYKSGGLSTYSVPDLKVNQGDRIFFLVWLKLGKEEFDTVVRVELTINLGDPHKGGNRNHTPSPLPPPQTSTAPSPEVRPGGSSGSKQRWSWTNTFTINTTENTVFTTQEAANRWIEEANILKSTLNDMKFHFLDPKGLSISISGRNEDIKVLDFNMKLNEEFRGLGSGQFVANITLSDGRWNYYYPNLKLKQGDKIYYWMRVRQEKKAFDSIVRGSCEVKYGDLDNGGDAAEPINPYYPPSTSNPYPTPSPFNPYPNPSPSNPYPSPLPSKPYPPPSPSNPYPTPSPSNPYPYPPPSPSNPYPTLSPSNPYTLPSPSNPYPPASPPTQNSCTQYSLSRANIDGVARTHCKGQIMLQHQFNTLDGWTYQVSIGGNNPEDEFTCFTNFKENTWVQPGRLNIKPTLLEERSNDTFVRLGELHLNGCTLDDVGSKYCHRKAQGYQILHPVESARISSQKRFTFRYGTVEIRAKLPQGDWLVPELWLEPTNTANSAANEKIVLGVSTGNTGQTSYKLEAGVVKASDDRFSLTNITGSKPWFEGFHTFKLEWTPNTVTFLVDNRQILEIPTANFAVFSQEVYISLGLHAGGYRDFPDDLFPTKPWMNSDVKRIAKFWDAKRDWYPTWSSESAFQVEYVKVTAL